MTNINFDQFVDKEKITPLNEITYKKITKDISESTSNDKTRITGAFVKRDLELLSQRGIAYQMFLEHSVIAFNRKNKTQQRLKQVFFYWTMALLTITVVGALIGICIILKKATINYIDLGAVISAIVGIITAYIVLPRVIAENLFPSTEDDKTQSLFAEMFRLDMDIRRLYSNTDNEVTETDNQDE